MGALLNRGLDWYLHTNSLALLPWLVDTLGLDHYIGDCLAGSLGNLVADGPGHLFRDILTYRVVGGGALFLSVALGDRDTVRHCNTVGN